VVLGDPATGLALGFIAQWNELKMIDVSSAQDKLQAACFLE
jgi:hypothetical protein